MLETGMKAPDITLKDLQEQPVRLSQFWDVDQKVVLVFLRHLG